MDRTEFIGKLQMVYVGDRNAFNEIVGEYDRLNNIMNELEKIFKDYGTKEDIVGYSVYYISGETIINILDKIEKLKEE